MLVGETSGQEFILNEESSIERKTREGCFEHSQLAFRRQYVKGFGFLQYTLDVGNENTGRWWRRLLVFPRKRSKRVLDINT